MPQTTLAEFYALMQATVPARRTLVESALNTSKPGTPEIDVLHKAVDHLRSLPLRDGLPVLALTHDSELTVDLGYEIGELERDITFFESGEDALLGLIDREEPGFAKKAHSLAETLKDSQFGIWFTDRDGTVNNYCGRYLSSVQSAYNAVFLTRFARSLSGPAVVLTSAPLDKGGLIDISTGPARDFINAGSKGREFVGPDAIRQSLPIAPAQQALIDNLNRELENLLQQPEFRKFALIGSGFQRKFGQTTVARQDISGAIDKGESNDFLDIIRKTVANVDPSGTNLTIEDTGKDIEIIATIATDQSTASRDFDKGDGIRFLRGRLGIAKLDKPCLVCGDTGSDIPMLRACAALYTETTGILVTQDASLRQRATATGVSVHFADSPDVLVCALNELSQN